MLLLTPSVHQRGRAVVVVVVVVVVVAVVVVFFVFCWRCSPWEVRAFRFDGLVWKFQLKVTFSCTGSSAF